MSDIDWYEFFNCTWIDHPANTVSDDYVGREHGECNMMGYFEWDRPYEGASPDTYDGFTSNVVMPMIIDTLQDQVHDAYERAEAGDSIDYDEEVKKLYESMAAKIMDGYAKIDDNVVAEHDDVRKDLISGFEAYADEHGMSDGDVVEGKQYIDRAYKASLEITRSQFTKESLFELFDCSI